MKEIRKRDNSLKKARKSNLERDWDLYKQEKNSVSSLIRRRKQAYYKNKISENKINTRKLWNLIKSLSCDDDESQSSIEKLIDSGNVITDKTSTAELWYTFFIHYPKNLISIQSTHLAQSPSAINQVEHAFVILSITIKRVSELLLFIPSHKVTGDGGISTKIFKIAAPAVLPSLTQWSIYLHVPHLRLIVFLKDAQI